MISSLGVKILNYDMVSSCLLDESEEREQYYQQGGSRNSCDDHWLSIGKYADDRDDKTNQCQHADNNYHQIHSSPLFWIVMMLMSLHQISTFVNPYDDENSACVFAFRAENSTYPATMRMVMPTVKMAIGQLASVQAQEISPAKNKAKPKTRMMVITACLHHFALA